MTPSEQIDSRRASATFRSLGTSGEIWLCADACLELRPASSACARCRDACPVKAFAWTVEGVRLNPGCTGCGQCAAVCPSGAIRVAGFEPEKLQSATQRIECRCLPEPLAGDAARVSCLGGLSPTLLLSLAAGTQVPWQLVDRGWCASCPAGDGAAFVAAEAVEVAGLLLDALGVAKARHPLVASEPLPVSIARPLVNASDGASVSRRGFFGAFVRQAVAAAETAVTEQLPVKADRGGCRPSPVIQLQRKRFSADLHQLAQEAGGAVPASFFPSLEIAEHCFHHGMCAAVCPSGALRLYEDEPASLAGLEFDAQICVACGLCVRQCPSGAIRLLPAGNEGAVAVSGMQRLTNNTQKICTECAASFVGMGSDDLCPRCRTDRNLAVSIFGTLLADKQVSEGNFNEQYSATSIEGGRS